MHTPWITRAVLAASILAAAGIPRATADERAPAANPQASPMSIANGAAPADPGAPTPAATEPPTILWKGFLTGDRNFADFPRPVGSPLYFEDPFINTDLRLLYVWHKFPDGSALHGGDLNVYAAQIRLALTERLQFTATCDGYSDLNARALRADEGWNDLALGLKYAFYVDPAERLIASAGLKWRLSNGHNGILMGIADELTPYLSAAKSWGKFNTIAHVAGRLPMDESQGNYIVSWDVHFDYEVIEHFFPLLEVHGLHYLSNADRLPLDVGGLDYANIGSNDVQGESVYWGGVGFRWNFAPHWSWGATYEFPLQNPDNNDLMDQRVTTNVILTY